MIYFLIEKFNHGDGDFVKRNILASFSKETIQEEKSKLENIISRNILLLEEFRNKDRELYSNRIPHPAQNIPSAIYKINIRVVNFQQKNYNIENKKLNQYYIDNYGVDFNHFDSSVKYEIDSVEFK